LLDVSKEVDLEVNIEETKCIVICIMMPSFCKNEESFTLKITIKHLRYDRHMFTFIPKSYRIMMVLSPLLLEDIKLFVCVGSSLSHAFLKRIPAIAFRSNIRNFYMDF
jgi:hypothetical protein